MSQSNKILGFLVVLLSILSHSLSAQNSITDLSPEQYFDFWIGEWEVMWENPDGLPGKGTNRIEKILDGKVIQEHFEITEGIGKGFKGTSISVYNQSTQIWKQAWADSNGGYFDFTGKFDGNKRIFQTTMETSADGRETRRRMVFYDISENAFTWDWELTNDGGINWELKWRIFYKRIDI